MSQQQSTATRREPWNKGKLVGQKPPLKLREVWAIRIRLQIAENRRDLALFNMAIDSKLRGCDLVSLRLNDVEQGGRVMPRGIIQQKKTGRPVQFEITPQSREAIQAWRDAAGPRPGDYLFPSRMTHSPHLFDPAARPIDGRLGLINRSGSEGLRYALHAPHQGHTALSSNEESACRSTTARPHQT